LLPKPTPHKFNHDNDRFPMFNENRDIPLGRSVESANRPGVTEYIDGLRALAALWVAAHHVIETSVPAATLELPVLGSVLASLFFGQFPVMMFLMLSGFCLYYPCVEGIPHDRNFWAGLLSCDGDGFESRRRTCGQARSACLSSHFPLCKSASGPMLVHLIHV
jgi:hypothetical protein